MMVQRTLRALLAAALVVLLPVAVAAREADRVTVLAAASLTDALQQIGKSYETASGKRVVFSFAASMILAKQIEASAGADIFVSADADSMDYLESRGLLAKGTRTNLLGNSLVLVAPVESKLVLTIAPGFKLADALQGGRLALANAESVPAGRYGKAALTALRVWDGVAGRLAQGEDVRATLAYVARGEAPLGIGWARDSASLWSPSMHTPTAARRGWKIGPVAAHASGLRSRRSADVAHRNPQHPSPTRCTLGAGCIDRSRQCMRCGRQQRRRAHRSTRCVARHRSQFHQQIGRAHV